MQAGQLAHAESARSTSVSQSSSIRLVHDSQAQG